MLTLPARRTAAFEVMGYDEDYGIHLDKLLYADDYHWPAVGRWWWTIQVGSRSDVPRLRESYERIVLLAKRPVLSDRTSCGAATDPSTPTLLGSKSQTASDYRDVGNRCMVMITELLCDVVYDPTLHLRKGEKPPGRGETKKRFDRYIETQLQGKLPSAQKPAAHIPLDDFAFLPEPFQ